MMKIYDVTFTVEQGMTVWPGDNPVQLYRQQKIEDGANANVSFLGLSVHTGTHIDAPFHFLKARYGVERIPLDLLVGEAQVVQIPTETKVIDAEVLKGIVILPGVRKILFKTSMSQRQVNLMQAFHTEFVAVAADAAQILVDMGINVIGIDYLSIAPYKNSRPTHEILLNANTLIIEGLNLADVDAGLYKLYCLPLKLKGSDGAPARVILVQD
jgi:arylformamidase